MGNEQLNEELRATAAGLAETAIRWGDTLDFLQALGDFALAMAEKHRQLQEQEQHDEDTARRLLGY